jgi:hypothetical protein
MHRSSTADGCNQSRRIASGEGRSFGWRWIAYLILAFGLFETASARSPRIVNIYNFIRNSDFRLDHSEDVLYEATRNQIALLKQYHLPATWALQYDALINPRYQKLLKEQLGPDDEIAAWWEIPQPLAEKAGVTWRGRHEWDPAANVGFSPGYTPAERRKLLDVYMADFKSIFGYYPRTIGSWYIDEVTLAYAVDRYGIVASCNCKDQIGTDFYTLWGGYWNQAYYPSRLNAYMPAQTRAGQIDVPIFRMLGSDPIYQHGTTPGLISLEPVYHAGGGGMPKWVDWFMNSLTTQPCLAFGYAQAGQENSFGWDAMQKGLTNQIPLFAALAKAGKIQVQTIEQSGKWFRKNFPLTPATAVVALDDWNGQARKTIWYDSRFFRLNLLWETDSFFIRDLHCFDESIVSPTHDAALKATSLSYETLPIVDWASWSDFGRKAAGMFPVLIAGDGTASPMQAAGVPAVKQLTAVELGIVQPIQGGGTFSIICGETQVRFTAVDKQGKPLPWGWNLIGSDGQKSVVRTVTPDAVHYRYGGTDYELKAVDDSGSFKEMDDGTIRLVANNAGKITLVPSPSARKETEKSLSAATTTK